MIWPTYSPPFACRCPTHDSFGFPGLTGILHAPVVPAVIWSQFMGDRKYLTAEEVAERYRGAVSVGTLRNWRAMRIGRAFVKKGKVILYPVDELNAWEKRNMVSCRASGRPTVTATDQA
jgi:Helix-turn-helix domain